jgi:hypothetical protein
MVWRSINCSAVVKFVLEATMLNPQRSPLIPSGGLEEPDALVLIIEQVGNVPESVGPEVMNITIGASRKKSLTD